MTPYKRPFTPLLCLCSAWMWWFLVHHTNTTSNVCQRKQVWKRKDVFKGEQNRFSDVRREKVVFMGTKEMREKTKAAGRTADERTTKRMWVLSTGRDSIRTHRHVWKPLWSWPSWLIFSPLVPDPSAPCRGTLKLKPAQKRENKRQAQDVHHSCLSLWKDWSGVLSALK